MASLLASYASSDEDDNQSTPDTTHTAAEDAFNLAGLEQRKAIRSTSSTTRLGEGPSSAPDVLAEVRSLPAPAEAGWLGPVVRAATAAATAAAV